MIIKFIKGEEIPEKIYICTLCSWNVNKQERQNEIINPYTN